MSPKRAIFVYFVYSGIANAQTFPSWEELSGRFDPLVERLTEKAEYARQIAPQVYRPDSEEIKCGDIHSRIASAYSLPQYLGLSGATVVQARVTTARERSHRICPTDEATFEDVSRLKLVSHFGQEINYVLRTHTYYNLFQFESFTYLDQEYKVLERVILGGIRNENLDDLEVKELITIDQFGNAFINEGKKLGTYISADGEQIVTSWHYSAREYIRMFWLAADGPKPGRFLLLPTWGAIPWFAYGTHLKNRTSHFDSYAIVDRGKGLLKLGVAKRNNNFLGYPERLPDYTAWIAYRLEIPGHY